MSAELNIEAERTAFEAWVSASGRAHLLGRQHPHGWYKDLTISAWWTAWEARAAIAAAAPPHDQQQAPTIRADLTYAQIARIATAVAGCQFNLRERQIWEFGSITLAQFARAILAAAPQEGSAGG